jgi:integrase
MRCTHFCGSRPAKGHVCEPLSTSTARKIHYVIRGALGCAARWKYLGVNVAEMVEAPSPEKTKHDPPSAAGAAALLSEAWRDETWGTLIWLVMVTGCRRGELCALPWSDVDFEHSGNPRPLLRCQNITIPHDPRIYDRPASTSETCPCNRSFDSTAVSVTSS